MNKKKESKVVPNVRFKGFTDDWKQRKLGELAFFNPKEELPDVFEYVDLESVVGIEMLSHRTEEKATAPSRAQRLAHTGDLFYQTVRPYQKNNYLFEKSEKHYVFSTGYAQLRPLVDGYFLLSLVQNGQFVKTVLDNCTGTSYPAINANDLAEIEVFYSKDEHEHHQIGEYFRHLDNLITLHQQKITLLTKLKKAMLEKMFPKKGMVSPEIRFNGFANAWKQRKLTEIVNRVNKSSNSDVLPKVEFEDIVSGEGRLNKDISSKFDSRKGTLFEPENILYGKLRPYLKNWLFSDFEGVALGDFWVFEATDVSVPSFDYYLIQSDDYQKVANDTSGTKMPRSDWKNVSSTDFAIPSKDEQKQIGAFFKQLDDTITLHQRKIDKIKNMKKAMLDQMFI